MPTCHRFFHFVTTWPWIAKNKPLGKAQEIFRTKISNFNSLQTALTCMWPSNAIAQPHENKDL